MAKFINEPSHTFNEYLLIPGYTPADCVPSAVSLKTPLVKFKRGEEPEIAMNIPMVSAVMQSVSDESTWRSLWLQKGAYLLFSALSL